MPALFAAGMAIYALVAALAADSISHGQSSDLVTLVFPMRT